VLAAAIVGGADVIVTRNLRDFPEEVLARYEIEAQHPDIFVRHLIDLSPVAVLEAMREQLAALTRPPVAADELFATFEKLGLVETTTKLRRLIND
jgi:hypothetical protein